MSLVQVLFLLGIWIFPIVFFISMYFKMTKDDQGKFKVELKRPSVFLGGGIPLVGLLLFLSGFFSAVKILQHFGAILLLLSWIATCCLSLKRGKNGAVESVAFLLIGVVGVVTYNYLF